LVILISENIELIVGALGRISFEKGYYLYIGSGMGSNGSATLEGRVNRHILPSAKKKRHWHIDYLLDHEKSNIDRLYLIPSRYRLECIIARELTETSDTIIKDFGSSDCHCKSHLFYFKKFQDLTF
jgi:Uri superfamily endonuclease